MSVTVGVLVRRNRFTFGLHTSMSSFETSMSSLNPLSPHQTPHHRHSPLTYVVMCLCCSLFLQLWHRVLCNLFQLLLACFDVRTAENRQRKIDKGRGKEKSLLIFQGVVATLQTTPLHLIHGLQLSRSSSLP